MPPSTLDGLYGKGTRAEVEKALTSELAGVESSFSYNAIRKGGVECRAEWFHPDHGPLATAKLGCFKDRVYWASFWIGHTGTQRDLIRMAHERSAPVFKDRGVERFERAADCSVESDLNSFGSWEPTTPGRMEWEL